MTIYSPATVKGLRKATFRTHWFEINPVLGIIGECINADPLVPPSQRVVLFPLNGKLFPPQLVGPPFCKGLKEKKLCI